MAQKRNPIYDNAYESYLSGLSLEQVARAIGITRQGVFKAFKRRGFTLRGKNFKPFQIYDDKKFSLRNTGYYSLTTDQRVLMHRYVWEKEKGKIPSGDDIHHIDRNKANNLIDNLQCMPKSEHSRLYATGNNQYTKCK